MQIKDKYELIKQELVKCKSDPVYFSTKYCKIASQKDGIVPFKMYDFQQRVMSDLHNNERNIILKSRQLGISTVSAMYALWLMLFHKSKACLVLATNQGTAKNIITKVRIAYENLPVFMRVDTLEYNKLSISFSNNSSIKAVAATTSAGRSESLSLLIIDEAAFITPDNKVREIWTSTQQTLAPGASCIILSSPNSTGNFFHDTWSKAENGENNFNFIRLPWTVHPERDQTWRDRQDIELGEKKAAQECDCNFLTSGNTFIDTKIISEYMNGTDNFKPIDYRYNQELLVWEYPLANTNYIVSADVSRGDSNDFSAFQVLKVENLEQVAEFKGKLDTQKFGTLLCNISREYNDALLIPENNGIGWATIQAILNDGYKNLYYSVKDLKYNDPNEIARQNAYNLHDKSNLMPGVYMSNTLRELMLDKLERLMRHRDSAGNITTYPIIRSQRLLNEMMTFISLNGRSAAMQGKNDDLIMSYSIGLYMRDMAYQFNKKDSDFNKMILKNTGKVKLMDTNKPTMENPYRFNVGQEEIDYSFLIRG